LAKPSDGERHGEKPAERWTLEDALRLKSLAFMPDGRTLAVLGERRDSGKTADDVSALAFSPSGEEPMTGDAQRLRNALEG
jgi:hypothetical protein